MADALIEDKPPMLRFEQTAELDTIGSEQAKKPIYMDVIKVKIRASGDIKCEVPYIAKKTAYDTFTKKVDVKKQVPRYYEDPETKETKETIEEITVQEDRVFYTKKIIEPWKDTLKQRLKNNAISQDFYNHCVKAQDNFENNLEAPIDGFPVKEWISIDASHRKRLLELGFNSIEKVAEMTEEGMAAFGMGARSVKQKAEAFLAVDHSADAAAGRIQKLSDENEDLRDNLSALEQKINELMANQPKKTGRPKKEVPAA